MFAHPLSRSPRGSGVLAGGPLLTAGEEDVVIAPNSARDGPDQVPHFDHADIRGFARSKGLHIRYTIAF